MFWGYRFASNIYYKGDGSNRLCTLLLYSYMNDILYTQCTFKTWVFGKAIYVKPDLTYKLFAIPRIDDGLVLPYTTDDKGKPTFCDLARQLCVSKDRFRQTICHKDLKQEVIVVNLIVSYILQPLRTRGNYQGVGLICCILVSYL